MWDWNISLHFIINVWQNIGKYFIHGACGYLRYVHDREFLRSYLPRFRSAHLWWNLVGFVSSFQVIIFSRKKTGRPKFREKHRGSDVGWLCVIWFGSSKSWWIFVGTNCRSWWTKSHPESRSMAELGSVFVSISAGNAFMESEGIKLRISYQKSITVSKPWDVPGS